MTGPKLIKSLERGLLVLQALQMQPDSSLRELHAFTGISKPSLLRILHTLARSGVVTRRLADGRYRIGAMLSHTPSRREHRDRIAEAAAPILERLCERVSWPSDLMVPAGDHMEIRETSRATQPDPLAGGAGWIAGELAADRGRTGLSGLLSCEGTATHRRDAPPLEQSGGSPGARAGASECHPRRGSCARLRNPRSNPCRWLVWQAPACGWFVFNRGSAARRVQGFGRGQHRLAQNGYRGRELCSQGISTNCRKRQRKSSVPCADVRGADYVQIRQRDRRKR